MLTLPCDILCPRFGFPRLVAALRAGHEDGVDLVERALLTEPRQAAQPNHLLVWPAWRFGRYIGAKLVTVFPDNPGAGRPTNETAYVLFDGAHGGLLAVMHGNSFTLMKTAADSALAADFLARPDSAVMLMIGAGAQAPAQIAAHLSVRPSIREVLIWNRSPERAERLSAGLGEDALAGPVLAERRPAVRAVRDLAAAVSRSDIVSAATGSTEPVLKGAWLRPGTHVDLVGGFIPSMREADDEAVARARVHVDTRRFTREGCGDIAGPIASGALREDAIAGDLFDLCRGTTPGRVTADEITLFKNAGGGHLDLMTAAALWEWHGATGA